MEIIIQKSQEKLEAILKNCLFQYEKITLVGSVATETSLETSDVDFVTYIHNYNYEDIVKILENHLEFRGERIATATTTRLLFCTKIDNHHIDLNIMTEDDYHSIIKGMYTMKRQLSPEQKQEIVRQKFLLKNSGNKNDYEIYKNSFYQKYCPEFIWQSDLDIVNNIKDQYIKENKELPAWIIHKISTIK